MRRSGVKEYLDDTGDVADTSVYGKILVAIAQKYGNAVMYRTISDLFRGYELDERVIDLIAVDSSDSLPFLIDQEWQERFSSYMHELEYHQYFLTSSALARAGSLNAECLSEMMGIQDSIYMDLVSEWRFGKGKQNLYPPDQPHSKDLSAFINAQLFISTQDNNLETIENAIKEHVLFPHDEEKRFSWPYSDTTGEFLFDEVERVRSIFQCIHVERCQKETLPAVSASDHEIWVNHTLADAFYEDAYLDEINQVMASYFVDLIGEPGLFLSDEQDREIHAFYVDNHQKLYEKVTPLIVKNSIFDMDFAERSFDRHPPYDQRDIAFIRFFHDNWSRIDSYRSKKVLQFEKTLRRFLFNKKIQVTNTGLQLANPDGIRISLDHLSSGEKKIVILAFISIFLDKTSIFLDEPELSLSIIWQTWLLDMLLGNEEREGKIIIATHSPYILEDERWQQYLQPLYLNLGGGNH